MNRLDVPFMNPLHLRHLNPTDAAELQRMALAWIGRPQVEEFLGNPDTFDAAKFIADAATVGKRLIGIWDDRHLAGVISVRLADPHAVTFGYLLERAYRGRGLMTRACAAVIDYVFTGMKRHRIEIQSDEANPKSSAILDRLGFCREGVRRQAACYGDFYGNLIVFGMLAPEWSPPADQLPWVDRPGK